MNKNLRFSLITLLLMLCGTVLAQSVTLDFTTNGWELPEGNTNKAVDAQTFTNGTYQIILAGSEGNGYYFNKDGYLMLGKQGASLTLPAFDFDVEKIEITGTSGASAAVKQNIFVGEDTVSTETTGAKNVTNVYLISEYYQRAGNNYTLKVTSNHNTQITKIAIYKKGEGGEDVQQVATPVITPNGGEFTDSIVVRLSCATQGATIMYSLANDWNVYKEPITLTETSVVEAYAVRDSMVNSESVRATFTKIEPQPQDSTSQGQSQEIVFDFNNDYATLFPTITGTSSSSDHGGDITEPVTATVGYVSVTVSPADTIVNKTPNRIWNANPRLRMYSGTITFTSVADSITKIVFTQTTNTSHVSDKNTVDSGELTTTDKTENGTVIWKGDAKSVTFTIAGNTQFSKAVVTLGQEVITIAAPVFSPESCEFTDSIEVMLSCETEGAAIMYAFADASALEWQAYNEPIKLTESATIAAKAVLPTGEESDMVRAVYTKKEPVQINTISVADAIDVINALEGTSSTTDTYDVEGYIVSIKEVSLTYGNATYYIADKAGDTDDALYVFRGYYLDNEKFTSEDQIGVGDKVIIRGKLQNYNNSTPEIANGNYIVSIEKYEAPETQTAKPVFSPNGGKFVESVDVELTCATEGATIMYAVASATSLEWQEYIEPITLTESTDLMAYAIRDGLDVSETVRASFEKVDIATVDSIGAFIALDNNTVAKLNLNNNVQVVFAQKSGNYEYVVVQDDTKARMVMYNLGLTDKVKTNDILTGSIVGKYSLYNGVHEMVKDNDLTDISTITATEGTAIKVDQLASVDKAFDPYKHLKLCKISKVSLNGNAAYDETGSIQVYDYFKVGYQLPELEEGQTLNITGIIIPFDRGNAGQITYEIAPISQEAIEVVYPPYYKTFAQTEVFIPTAEALAEAMKPEAAWVEWGGTRTDNKTLHINPLTDEAEQQKSAPGIGLKNGNSSKSFVTLVQGVEAVWTYGSSTNSNLRTMRVTATDEEGASVTAQETTDGQTATIKVRGLNPNKRYRVVYTGLDGDGTSGSGADMVLHAVKFLPKDIADPIPGDINGDLEVGIGDIVAITNVMAGIFQAGLDEEAINAIKARADVNGDGEVGIGDIVAITNIMAGNESSTTEPEEEEQPVIN